jgi:hypothetical protein
MAVHLFAACDVSPRRGSMVGTRAWRDRGGVWDTGNTYPPRLTQIHCRETATTGGRHATGCRVGGMETPSSRSSSRKKRQRLMASTVAAVLHRPCTSIAQRGPGRQPQGAPRALPSLCRTGARQRAAETRSALRTTHDSGGSLVYALSYTSAAMDDTCARMVGTSAWRWPVITRLADVCERMRCVTRRGDL